MKVKHKAAIIVASDRAAQGEYEDATGPALQTMLERAGYDVAAVVVVPDELELLSRTMREWCDTHKVPLLLTAGGTGFSPRDRTPEATLAIAERLAPGLAEAMRAAGAAIAPKAMLSRGVAALRGRTLILNLPGRPRGACENLAVVLPVLGHGLDILGGACEESAAK